MASAVWNGFAVRFRAFLPTLRALARDQNLADEFERVQAELDTAVDWFPEDLNTQLQDELNAASDPEDATGSVASLPSGDALATFVDNIVKQIEQLAELLERTEDEEESADLPEAEEVEEEAAEEEPPARKTLGETSEGKGTTYRGDIKAVVGVGGSLAFVTVHPEGVPTALYWLDADKLALQQDALPCGGVAIAADGNTVYVGGTDKRLYECGKKAPKTLAGPFTGDIAAIVPLSKKRIAVLNGKQIDIISDKDGSTLQTLELPEDGTCLSTDKSASWLAAGTTKGNVAVFDGQDKDEFELSETAKLHDGAVTVIRFEPEELRFFSAGADNKLLTTFARGSLEPEDKGRGNMHEDVLTAFVYVPGDRIVTGSRDATLKNWPRAGAVKPSTIKDTVGRVVGLAVVTVYNQPHVAVACDDNSIRLLKIETDGKFPGDPVTAKVTGAADWIRNELAQKHDPKRREKALKILAEWKDSASIDILGEQIDRDPDHKIREYVADLLDKSDSPRVTKILEKAVGHGDGKVRVIAFEGLRKRTPTDLNPIDLALKTGQADVGVLAVKALEPLAKKDDQALTRLVDTLDASTWDVRKTALESLETVYDAKSPTASLTALNSKHGDMRSYALRRAYERWLLEDPAVQSAIRRRLEDGDASVRKVAFLLSVLSKAELAAVLRASDTELNRQLNELEKAEKPDKAAPAVAADAKTKLTPNDYDTLLQATASRALDTCLRGARGLAVLGDPRAFGLLLQLSREEDVNARVDVCRALAALDDERAVNRLRSLLFDKEASVRDAAYTALAKIFDKTPLSVAESGLTASDEDVRRRGLETLIQTIKKKTPKAESDPGWSLLVRALNDTARGVRSEAFKAALNLKIGGGGPDTLRFTLKSNHPDVRREALTEITAQEKEPWSAPLLYEFFNDPDPGLRKEAFEFATKKNKEISVLETCLASRYPDARKLAVEGLIKKHSKAAQQVLLRAINDADREVRLLATNALVDDDAKAPLAQAMTNERADIRVRAAAALAKHGDASAYPVLTELATAPEPQLKERVSDWLEVTEFAILGLGELGDPRALSIVVSLTDSPHARLRKAAASALMWVAKTETMDTLRTAMKNADPEVNARAALGLTYLGDATVAPNLRDANASRVLTQAEQFTATIALGAAAGVQGTVYLDSPDEKLRDRALLATLLLELKDTDGQPEKCIECVSAKGARFRLTGAQAIESFADRAAFREFVIKEVNDRGEDTPWKIAPEVVDDFANLLAFGSPQVKAKTALLLRYFDNKEQAEWNSEWAVHAARFAKEIKEATETAKKKGVPVPSKLTPEQLRELAFGGYVGLVREQGASGGGQSVAKIRQTALARIFAIASKDAKYNRAAQPVLAQAMGDPNQPVRTQAFEHLQALGMDKAALGGEALEAGYTDLGVKGLELLTDGTSAKKGEAVLERVMLARSDDLAIEAAKLLRDRRNKIDVAKKALDSVYEPMRQQAVEWLAAQYEESADAQKFLRAALESRYRKVREKAAFELAGKKDPTAYEALAKFLAEAKEANQQNAIVEALNTLGDKRAADALIDRIENDPGGTAAVESLLTSAAEFRVPKTADRFFLLLDKMKDWQETINTAILTVSGHDQWIGDAEDENPQDRQSWMKDQQPRHDAILARLMDRAFATGETDYIIGTLLAPARWSIGKDVDAVFATLCTSPNVDLRDAAIQAYGFRFRKRGASPDPLLKAVKHKNPVTQFFAAEALARGGRAEGMQVLLSGIEYLEDQSHRVRAVQALGELGDPRCVDKLLSLASEDGNPLQDAATEAIGHLKKSQQADAVFRLLEKHAKGQGNLTQRALIGLRWFDTPSGWDIVRAKVTAKGYGWYLDQIRATAAEQLGYNDDPSTRDLLLKTVRTSTDYRLVMAAYASIRRLVGKESLEPNYNLLQNSNASSYADNVPDEGGALEPVVKKGNPLRIMEIFPNCSNQIQEQLETALLTRPDLPVKEATAALAHADEGTVRLATRLLGRVPNPDANVKNAIGNSLTKWWTTWQERRAKTSGAMPGSNDDDDYYDDDDYGGSKKVSPEVALKKAGEVVESLLFTSGRVGVQTEAIANVAKSRPDDPLARSIRLEAVRCLALGKTPSAVLDTLESLAVGLDADVRVLATELLARFDPKRAAKLAQPDKALSDRPSFNRLVTTGAVTASNVATAAANVHYQPVALPVFVAEKDVKTLAAVAKDRKAPEAARYGAVEGLGVMATEPAEQVLVEIGTAKDDDKELRKAAWRALRRSKRARKRGATTTLATMPKAPKAAKAAPGGTKSEDQGDE